MFVPFVAVKISAESAQSVERIMSQLR